MDRKTRAEFLTSKRGRAALASLHEAKLGNSETLPLLTRLRSTFTPEQSAALLSQARLRQQAQPKFPEAHQLFFEAEALEQATTQEIAQQRAAWFDRWAPPGPVLELGCGIGGDTLALAQRRSVIAYEVDPVRLWYARANVATMGLAHRVEFRCQDWTVDLQMGRLPPAAAAFADPSRRVHDRRIFHLAQMQPPIEPLLALQCTIPALGVKVMPGVQDEELPSACGLQFISHEKVCKEAILWFGPLARHKRWASVLTGNGWQQIVASGVMPPLGPLRAGQVLHEPDPAVIRAGAFDELCTALDAHLFDPQIAYLVTDKVQPHPLTRSFVLWEVHPFQLKTLNQRLQALGVSSVELKKRGAPFAPEQLRTRLKLVANGRPAVVIFTRRGDQRLMLIGERVGGQ